MATTAIDAPFLAASFGVPEPSINTLLEDPTLELVRTLLIQVEAKAREFDQITAEKLRTDVELENVVRTGEARAKALKASQEKSLKDVKDLNLQLGEEQSARARLEEELRDLKSSSTTSTSEAEALHTRISTLEASNRDTVALLEAKSTSHDRLAEELTAQHQKSVTLRRELSELETKVQNSEHAATSARFREQSLQQEIEMLKRNSDWHETELKTRSAEHTKFRKEKSARIAELQRANEDYAQEIEGLKRTESTLRNRLDQLNEKLEDSLQRAQQLQESAANAEQQFKAELEGTHRLVSLQEESANTSRSRLQEVSELLETTKDRAAGEIGQLQSELQSMSNDKAADEERIALLEAQVEKLEADVQNAAHQVPPAPSTPRRGMNGVHASTPGRGGSPGVFTPGTARSKAGLNFTQLYSEHTEMKAELERERKNSQNLRRHLDELIRDLEAKQPEQEELQLSLDRYKDEVESLSSLLEDFTREREVAKKDARRIEGQVEGARREAQLLQQQARDLGVQIKLLLVELQARDEGLDSVDATERMQLEQAARGELDFDEDMTDTGKYISRRLVIFKNVAELQEQNANLLLLVRTLGEKMEGEEAREKAGQQAQLEEELNTLREQTQRFEDEVRSLNTQSASYMRERDMFRRMLAHRGQLPPELGSMFDESIAPGSPQAGGLGASMDQTPLAKQLADYEKLLKEIQGHFDSYRQESATDQTTLREQANRLSKEKTELQTEIARLSSQLSLAHGRHENLQSNFDMVKTENGELSKRAQSLSETLAKQEIRTQQAAEDLIEQRALVDGMRNDNANLKAERELYKNVEARQSEDYRQLTEERTRLNRMVSDLQTLQNERELSESETRRRLQGRVEELESELSGAKRKIEEHATEAKNASLRRDYDRDQARTRIDDLMKGLSNTREELVAAKTQRDQLQSRVDELKIELRSAEERALALQPRPTPRPGLTTQPSANDENLALSREQELQLEVADLRRDLDLARTELEQAKAHVDQYKAISQASEEELQNLNDTNDQYREETDRLIAEKDARAQDLEKRVEEILEELTTTNRELTTLRTQQDEDRNKLNEQKSIYDSEIARLKDDSERHLETAKLYQEDLKAQAQIAQQRQQLYEDELVKHGDATRELQAVRAQYNELRTEMAHLKAETEAAKLSLSQNQESWQDARSQYEHELMELRNRREEVNRQNELLHKQLDGVSSQITALKDRRAALNSDDDSAAITDDGNLQEVIRYLRREKEIVDVQYELSIQESKRLKQQLDHAQAQLEQTREKLDQERRSQSDREQNAASHQKLMQTINELNLFRESNASLRNEARQAQTQLAEKSKRVEELITQLEPAQTRVREVENELETKDGEIKLLQEDRDRWQTRTQNILQKYDRVDPAELEALKNQLKTLETERDQLLGEKQPLQEQIDALPEQLKAAEEAGKKDMKDRLTDQFKARSREISSKMKERENELKSAKDQAEQLQIELTSVKEELERTQTARDEAVQRASASADVAMQSGMQEDEGIGFSADEKAALEQRAVEAEARSKQEADRANILQAEVDRFKSRAEQLEQQVQGLQQQLASSSSTADENALPSTDTEGAGDNDTAEHLERLRRELASAQQEVESLRNNAATAGLAPEEGELDATQPASVDIEAAVTARKAELDVAYQEKEKQLQETFNTRTDNMKKQLNEKLRSSRGQIQQANEEALEKLKSEHAAELQTLKDEHGKEVAQLRAQLSAAGSDVAPAQTTATGEAGSVAADVSAPAAQFPTPTVDVKVEPSTMLEKLSPKEIQDLVNGNATIKNILQRNIKAKVDQAKAEAERATEEKVTAARADNERQMEQRINDAVNLAGKKSVLQINMAQNKTKLLSAQIDVVKQASQDTPLRPVGEVWTIASQAKPAPAAAQTATGNQMAAGQPVQVQAAQSATPTAQQPGRRVSVHTAGSLAQQQRNPQSAQPPQAVQQTAAPEPAPSSPAPAANAPASTSATSQDDQANPQSPAGAGMQATRGHGTGPAALQAITNQAGGGQRGTGIPRGGPRGGARGGRGGIPQSTTQSALPQPAQGISIAGNASRGGPQQSGIPRGGGSARGRGGRGGGAGQGANLNPGATQFVPGGGPGAGNKRPHEDDGQGGGKRSRSGMGGGGG